MKFYQSLFGWLSDQGCRSAEPPTYFTSIFCWIRSLLYIWICCTLHILWWIGSDCWLDKCAKLSVFRGKVNTSSDEPLSLGWVLRNCLFTCKYWSNSLDCGDSKNGSLRKHLCLVWRTYLNGPCKGRATNKPILYPVF